ncbi:MAG: ROK family protein [Victivallaceae bacterium]|nr:ROK family protein [Victivallaceae bacterium]
MKEIFPILGYDVGGTKIAASLMMSDGKVIASERFDNKDTDPNEMLPKLVAAGKTMLHAANIPHSAVRGIGISTPSPADIPNGIIVGPPNNPKWRNVKIGSFLSNALGIEATMENDANAGMLAEWFFGAGKGCRNAIYLTMSTGIGGGIIASGRLLQGKSFYAGEIGHIVIDRDGPLCNCGLRGCYEAFCGGRAVAQRLQCELATKTDHAIVQAAGGKVEDIDFVALEKAVIAGDEYALKIWDEIALRNAQGIGILINIFNPEKVILGTIAWAAGELFTKPVQSYLPRFCWPEMLDVCEITTSALRRDIGAYAGPAIVLNHLYNQGLYNPLFK